MNNKFNGIFPSFNPFSSEFCPRDRLIDIFPNHFSFYPTDRKRKESRKEHICKLNKLTLQTSANLKTAVIVSDMSIKNQVATTIAHIHIHYNLVITTWQTNSTTYKLKPRSF